MPDVCEGPKRPSIGSEPDKLLAVDSIGLVRKCSFLPAPAAFFWNAFVALHKGGIALRRLGYGLAYALGCSKNRLCSGAGRTGIHAFGWKLARTHLLRCRFSVPRERPVQLQPPLRFKKPPGSRSRPDRPTVGVGDRVHESTKLAAVFDMLASQGCPADAVLRDVNIALRDVHSPQARISLLQLMTICQNAIRLSTDRHLPYRIGASIHISTYGMYGYAILCCPDFRKAMDFATRYHTLAAPLAAIEFKEGKGYASWIIEPNLHAISDPALYRFVTEMQIGVHISLMRDIMGSAFAPSEIELTYPHSGDFDLPLDHVGCPVRFDRPVNQIVFQSRWLDQIAGLGNKTTYPTIVALCDDLLGDLRLRIGVAGKIRAILLHDIANPPTFDAAAKLLAVNERSLRRQLRQQGFSFRGLRDELRTQIALKYLRSTNLANEDIALALGFSDAANFRRAFHRWTNKAPSEIRGE
jgi:AraC-like DNA-binding protein